jgi:hypothetical protein
VPGELGWELVYLDDSPAAVTTFYRHSRKRMTGTGDRDSTWLCTQFQLSTHLGLRKNHQLHQVYSELSPQGRVSQQFRTLQKANEGGGNVWQAELAQRSLDEED